MPDKLEILMPVCNEVKNIGPILNKINKEIKNGKITSFRKYSIYWFLTLEN